MTHLLLMLALHAAEPVVRSADVCGLQCGATTTLVIDGDDLGTAPRLLLPFAAKVTLKAGSTAKRATFDVALEAGVTPGFYNLRVVGDGGVSLPVTIAVDALPQKPLAAKVESLPVALHGSLSGSMVVSTQFTGKAGEKVTVEAEAQRLGSKLRPIVHLYDAKRRQLGWAWTAPTLGGDARLQATLPADGTYTVTLHDAEYAGATPGHFRLKLGQWSFADQVFPPVIGKGDKSVELLAASGPLRLDLPAERRGAVPLPWPKGGTWSGPRPFVAVSDRDELIAKGDGKVQDLPAGPVGVSGRLREAFAEDRFRVPVKPGEKVRLEAFAERIGSPLHVALVVRDEKGTQLARAEEGPTSLDPVLEYNVPAGVKAILVGVVDAQGRGSADGVYRLTIGTAEKPDFRLLTRTKRIVLPEGGRCVVPVLVERRGYLGAVELSAILPAGVKLEGTTIPAGADGALVTVQRGGAFEAALTRLQGADDKQERPVRVADDPLERVQPWAAEELPIAPTTAKAADFSIDWRALPADLGLVPARNFSLPVKLTPTASPVRLTLLTSQAVPLVNGQPDPNRSIRVERPTELAAKVSDGDLPIFVPAELAATSYEVSVQAELLSPDRRTVLATAYTPVRRLAVRMPLIVQLAGPRLEATLDAKKPVTVKLAGKVERREGLTGDVALTLTGLPPGASAAAVTVKAGVTDFAFDVVVPPTVPPGEVKGVKVTGTAAPDPKQPAVRLRSRDVELTLAILGGEAMTLCHLAILLILDAAPTPPPARIVSVRVHPVAVALTHPREPQSIQVLGLDAVGYSRDLRGEARFTIADAKVASVADGSVRPLATGSTELTVAVAGQTLKVPVSVKLPAAEPALSFRREVMPVLTQAGCNAGACHGYSLGKNGFKLSLRGEDAAMDFLSVTRDLARRRVTPLSPDESLLIRKGRGDVSHEGGMRFGRKSLANEILVKWIGEGAADDPKEPARVVGVKVFPDTLTLVPGQSHRLQLIAEYEDGTKRDVTRLGVFAANNDRFVGVDAEGRVTAIDPGETAVVGRFERTFTAASVTVMPPNPGFVPTPVPTDNLIDRHVVEKLNRLKIAPSARADDETFLRRVHLDLIGVQPTPDEVRAFLADTSAKNREKAIDALFERPEFIDHWSLKWGDLLQNSRNTVSSPAMYLFREFIRDAVASNMPMDRFARRLVVARGGPTDDPASVYYAISKDTNDTVERVTQVFCGVRMLCARCHTHPLENIAQAEYYGLASFFTQVSVRDARARNAPNAKLVSLNLSAALATHPRTGRPQPAKFLGGVEPKLEPGTDRRAAYAQWLTSPSNPYFARGLVNRTWSYFFHRGIIEPVDDVRSTNPPINPALLDALTKDFVESKFDARHLMRRIVTSEAYQRGGAATPSNRHDELNFSRAVPRRIPAEALLDSLVQASAVAESFGGAPAGFRAAQLPDGNVENAFLRLFGKPQRMDACECERDNSSNLLQALHFINGKSILSRVQNPAGRPALLLRQKLTDEQLVTELYLWSLSRNPRKEELNVGLEFLKSYGAQRAEAAQDLMWALLNSKDFLLAH